METIDNSLIIFMVPKEITSKKDGKKYTVLEGKLRCEGKDWDVSLFEGTSAKGVRYLKGKVKPPYTKPQSSTDPF